MLSTKRLRRCRAKGSSSAMSIFCLVMSAVWFLAALRSPCKPLPDGCVSKRKHLQTVRAVVPECCSRPCGYPCAGRNRLWVWGFVPINTQSYRALLLRCARCRLPVVAVCRDTPHSQPVAEALEEELPGAPSRRQYAIPVSGAGQGAETQWQDSVCRDLAPLRAG